jgi:predicted acetyltransferase
MTRPFEMSVSLERPSLRLRDSYVECLRDFQAEDPTRPVKWDWLENFDLYLEWCRREREATEGRAPQTTYWIVVDEQTAVGKLTLRHALTPALERLGGHFGYEVRPAYRRQGIARRAFELGLEKARTLGLKHIVVTCDDDNLGSIRVLEGAGGRLLETYAVAGWPKPVRKYEFC